MAFTHRVRFQRHDLYPPGTVVALHAMRRAGVGTNMRMHEEPGPPSGPLVRVGVMPAPAEVMEDVLVSGLPGEIVFDGLEPGPHLAYAVVEGEPRKLVVTAKKVKRER